MRVNFATFAGVTAILIATSTSAQMGGAPKAEANSATPAECANMQGKFLEGCLDRAKRSGASAAKTSGPGYKLTKSDAELVNSTNAAARLKLSANDFAGAAAEYQRGIDASPNNPAKHVLYAGLAMALRRQAVATFNGMTPPTPPPSGAGNAVILAFNQQVETFVKARADAATPLLQRALSAAATAAAASDASAIKMADEAIGIELREAAVLLFTIDPRGVIAASRPTASLETTWLNRWLAATPAPTGEAAARPEFAVAGALVGSDAVGALTLADAAIAQSGTAPDAALNYAEIVAAAKAPRGDPRRAKALAGLLAAEGGITDTLKRRRVASLKVLLAAS